MLTVSLSRIDVFCQITKNAIAIAVNHGIIKARYVYCTLQQKVNSKCFTVKVNCESIQTKTHSEKYI